MEASGPSVQAGAPVENLAWKTPSVCFFFKEAVVIEGSSELGVFSVRAAV